ncbi:MAG: glycosyltransferase [Spirochaetales bacterium]|nr:glycosyltransferase [Candidatus Physcosoma equi]
MKICFIFGNLCVSDGVARAATNIVNLLAPEGHEITVIPLYRVEEEAKARLDKRVRVKPVFGTYFKGMAKMIRYFCPQWILEKLIFDEKYDIEVAFQYDVPTLVVGRSSHKDARHYCWMHGYDTGLVFRSSYLKMDRIYCVSRYNRDRLDKELGDVPKPLIETCYNLSDDSIIQKKGKDPIELKKKGFTFCTVGRLSPEKGFLRLQECLRRLLDEGYDVNLWIVGDGPQREELLAKQKELHLEDAVVFTGAKNNPHPYSANADCFVCSSHSEGYSTVCTEAIILGTPVLTTRVPGGEEIIESAEAGLVVDNDDEALYQGMKYILDHQELLPVWRKTIETTKEKFSLKTREAKVLDIFKD